jgi:hypothetical protein
MNRVVVAGVRELGGGDSGHPATPVDVVAAGDALALAPVVAPLDRVT